MKSIEPAGWTYGPRGNVNLYHAADERGAFALKIEDRPLRCSWRSYRITICDAGGLMERLVSFPCWKDNTLRLLRMVEGMRAEGMH